MSPTKLVIAGLAPLVLLAAPAAAQGDDSPDRGVALSAGGGVTGFASDPTNDTVDTGGAWEARVLFGSRLPVGLEAAYIGSANPVDSLTGNATLIGHGLEGSVRVDLGDLDIQPYAFGGLGWIHYDIRSDRELALNLASDDEVVTLPAGGGIRWQRGRTIFDLRGTYRFAFDEELISDEGDLRKRESLDTWAATFRVGIEL